MRKRFPKSCRVHRDTAGRTWHWGAEAAISSTDPALWQTLVGEYAELKEPEPRVFSISEVINVVRSGLT